jgi:hypothetical protein
MSTRTLRCSGERGANLVAAVADDDQDGREAGRERGVDRPRDERSTPPREQRLRRVTTEALAPSGREDGCGDAQPERSGPARSGVMRTMTR